MRELGSNSSSAYHNRGAHTTTFLLKVSPIVAFYERINLALVLSLYDWSFLRDFGPKFGLFLAI